MIDRIQRRLKLIVGLIAAIVIIMLILKDSAAKSTHETTTSKISPTTQLTVAYQSTNLVISIIVEKLIIHRTH